MLLREGTVLEGRYRIESLLAHGGMSAVYRAHDLNLSVPVALKENQFQTAHSIEQFKREAQLLAKLRHPGLPRVLQHFTYEGRQYLVMEFIEGANLWEMVKKRDGPFTETQALAWMDKVCEAVSYLHSRTPSIVHRDIKPQNVKVMPSGEVVLVDFGISKEGDTSDRTALGARGVTPGFSPPEQYTGSGSGPVSDVYALGATLYALLTGVKPPDSISLAIGAAEYVRPDRLNPRISDSVADAIGWAMRPEPSNRPQSVEDWRAVLRGLTDHLIGPDRAVAVPAPAIAPAEPIREPGPAGPPVGGAAELPLSAGGVVCGACGSPNRQDVLYCEACGHSLVPPADAASMDAAMPDGPVCWACGASNRPGIAFCEACGAALSSRPVSPAASELEVVGPTCPVCGASSRTGVRYCEDCGADLAVPARREGDRVDLSGIQQGLMTCQFCREENRTGVGFCETCGAALSCPACGAENRAGVRFCETCGMALW